MKNKKNHNLQKGLDNNNKFDTLEFVLCKPWAVHKGKKKEYPKILGQTQIKWGLSLYLLCVIGYLLIFQSKLQVSAIVTFCE